MASWIKDEIILQDGQKVAAQMPIIVSASRSTDIPAFYSDWLMSRLKAGYVKWYNPFNNVPLYVSFKKTRLIVFWSKNPAPMLQHLDELDKICPNYYFQYTLNDYDIEKIEPRVPPLDLRVETFRRLSDRVGRDRVIWRFDPLMLTDTMDVKGLLDKIERLGEQIAQYTRRFVFSFIDINSYRKVAGNLANGGIQAREFTRDEMLQLAEGVGRLIDSWGISAGTCAEDMSLDQFKIEHNRCIDDRLMVKCFSHDEELMRFIGAKCVKPGDLFGPAIWEAADVSKKDAGQRAACGCIMSKDIGEYNTCPHLCHYCYANTNNSIALANWKRHLDCPCAETITGR
jgi:hypothetical protein